MKKLYFLFLTLLITSVSFGQIWTEDFASYTDGTGVEGSAGGVIVDIGDYPASVTKWSIDVTGAALTAASDWVKTDAGVFSFRDVDGPAIWQSEMIDISAAVSPVNFELTASNNAGGFETSDFYNVYYSIDGGAFTLVADWNGLGDATSTIIGEVGGVDWNTVETIQITGLSGSTLQIRVEAIINSGAERFFLDNIIVSEGALPPAMNITAPTDGAVFAPGTTSVNVSIAVQNFVVASGGAGDGLIHWTINGLAQSMKLDTNDEAIAVADGQSYTVFMELVDNTHTALVPAVNATVNFSVGSLTTVADITALRADVTANGLGRFYEITGGSLVTHTDGFRNRKWIQDSNISGVLIYDQAGTITTTYAVGDMVTGLRGTTEDSNGVLRFVPTSDAGTIASSGNAVTPQVVSIPAFNAAPDDYESELIRINNVTFVDGDGVATFGTGSNYNVTDGVNTVIKRTDFFSADYIGQLIPVGMLPGIVGVAGEFNGTSQIYVRSLSDLTLSVNQFSVNSFSLYPNPTSTGFVTITSINNEVVNVAVYDILGKQVKNVTLSNDTLDVSNLKSGIYILKISQEGNSVVKKLVIR